MTLCCIYIICLLVLVCINCFVCLFVYIYVLSVQKRKVMKLHMMKGSEGSGLTLFGGKHSKAGDIGIFIREIKGGSWAHR